MKVLTVLGTRPEIIRLSRIIPKLDQVCTQRIFHTGQNYDSNLNDIFFDELKLRRPDYFMDNKAATFSTQLSTIFCGMENALNDFKPDKVLILGDTNSSLCAIVAERLGYPVYHMEAGNRCYDLRVPEEKNRRVIDSVSSFNLPYTALSRENLIREGFPSEKIIVTGNPIREVLEYYKYYINASRILNRLGIHEKEYILVTSHRAENVDVPERLKNIFMALKTISGHYPVIFSCHPRTRKKLAEFNIDIGKNILLSNPFGFFDFVNLQQNSLLSITDSGTVQEESCLLGVKTLTIRDSTERPETVACGSNIITGLDIERILDAYRYAVNLSTVWDPPTEYLKMNVSDTVINILLGK